MQEQPLISVVMPVYNKAGELKRAADSVLGQTYGNLELILVDDGSTDESPAMVDAYAAEEPERVRVLHKANGGLMAAWRDGIGLAHGDILCFVDSDDWIGEKMLEEMAAHLTTEDGRACPGQIICSGCIGEIDGRPMDAVKHGLEPGVYEGERLESLLKQELLGHEERRVTFSRCMKLISAELIRDNLKYLDTRIRLGEDANIMVPALLDADHVVIMQEAYYHYVFVRTSMAHRYDGGFYDDIVRLRACLSKVIRDKGKPAEQKLQWEFLFLFLTVLKSEVRRTDGRDAASKAIRRIRELCAAEDAAALVRSFPDPIHSPANRMMASICRHPSAARIRIIRAIFLFYEWLRSHKP